MCLSSDFQSESQTKQQLYIDYGLWPKLPPVETQSLKVLNAVLVDRQY